MCDLLSGSSKNNLVFDSDRRRILSGVTSKKFPVFPLNWFIYSSEGGFVFYILVRGTAFINQGGSKMKIRRGAALIISMIFVAIFSSLAIAMLSMSSTNIRIAGNHHASKAALKG